MRSHIRRPSLPYIICHLLLLHQFHNLYLISYFLHTHPPEVVFVKLIKIRNRAKASLKQSQ